MQEKEALLREVRKTLTFLKDPQVPELADLKFSLNQIHSSTGIKNGRIQYWTDSGRIRDLNQSEGNNYHYTSREFRKILIIDQLYKSRNDGYTLKAAAQKADELLNIDEEKGAVAMLLFMRSLLERRVNEVAEELEESGLADQIIELFQ